MGLNIRPKGDPQLEELDGQPGDRKAVFVRSVSMQYTGTAFCVGRLRDIHDNVYIIDKRSLMRARGRPLFPRTKVLDPWDRFSAGEEPLVVIEQTGRYCPCKDWKCSRKLWRLVVNESKPEEGG